METGCLKTAASAMSGPRPVREGWIAGLALLAGTAITVRSAEIPKAPAPLTARRVEICTDGIADRVLLSQAQTIASAAFANIGIQIEWRNGRRSCRAGTVFIGVRESTPGDLLPGAVGYSRAFAGDFGEVFLDRIKMSGQPDLTPHLL